jgi:O-antigen/teichoic acid export membrane protein
MRPTALARGGGRGDGLRLAGASALNGLLSYAFFVIVTRALGATAAAPVSVLWSYWALAGAALTFPVQHWITRGVPLHGEGAVGRAMPRLAAVVGVLAVAAGGVSWLLREPLFGRDDGVFPALVALVTAGSALVGVMRGSLSARGRFAAVGAGLVVENAVRCVAAAALLIAGVGNPAWYGVSLLTGNLVVLLWPSALVLRGRSDGVRTSPFGYLAGAGLGQLANQVVLTGGPVVLALADGTQAEVTSLFAALALFRAPYLVALGVMPSVTARVTQLVLLGDHARLARLRRAVLLGSAAAVTVAAAGAAVAGPWLLRVIFGEDVRVTALEAAVVAVGCTLAVANLVLMVTTLAQGEVTGVAAAWLGALAVAGSALLVGAALDPVLQVVCAVTAAELAAFAGLALVTRRARPLRPPRSSAD